MAKTPATSKKTKAAPAKGKPKTAAKAGAPVAEGEAPEAAKAPRAKKDVGPVVTTVLHGETRLLHTDEAGAAALATATPLIDAVHALGRVRITSATHGGGTTMLHVVLQDQPPPSEAMPGLILAVDATGLVSFDHVPIGPASGDLVNDAAFALLVAMRGDDENPANAIGRRADWFQQAVIAAESIGEQYAAA